MHIDDLREYRKQVGLTQQQMADKLDMHRVNYNRMEVADYKTSDFKEKIRLAEDVIGNLLDKKIQSHKRKIQQLELDIKKLYK